MDYKVHARVLSDDPLIIFTANFPTQEVKTITALGDLLGHREVIFFASIVWDGEETQDEIVDLLKGHERTHPLHDCIAFVNTKTEADILERRGVRTFFGNQNSLVDPEMYRIIEGQSRDFVAIYNAALETWKRHELCADLTSVAFIYYGWNAGYEAYLAHLRNMLPNGRFLNHEITGMPFGGLPPDEVCRCLNRAQVGLCLSATEGAMLASIEYLLAGLPIVSTPSRGGRDFFFDRDFVEIAEPTSQGVANAVEAVLRRAPPAAEIRSRTIARQQERITAFIAFLDVLTRRHGGAGFTREMWDARYTNKLLHAYPSADALVQTIPMPSRRLKPRAMMRRAIKHARYWLHRRWRFF